MTDRFVGIGGNDGNSGLTWALRKLTLNGAEDTPVVAGDDVYVGPGVYREVLMVDVSGGNTYSAGTVTVTYGSTTVTGAGTAFLANVAAAYEFHVRLFASGVDGVANGTATFTSVAGNFQANMIGKEIQIMTRGAYRIGAVAAANSITLTDPNGLGWPAAAVNLVYSVMSGEGHYEIASVTDNNNFELVRPWNGPTLTGLAYLTFNPIRYIADVTGENTDGVGGIIRITGSDNDTTATRTNCFLDNYNTRSYRTFRGFYLDMTSNWAIQITGGNWIVEDCVIADADRGILSINATAISNTIRRCLFFSLFGGYDYGIRFYHTVGLSDVGGLVENCCFFGSANTNAIGSEKVGGIAVKNDMALGTSRGIHISAALSLGQTIAVNNNIIASCFRGFDATANSEITENYNTLFGNIADRNNTSTGASSVSYPTLLNPPILFDGIKFPWWFSELSEWSQVGAITGIWTAYEDLCGYVRPVTASKLSWGSTQFHDMERETGTVRTGSVSMVLHDAGRHQIWVPVEASSTTIRIYVYREANYAGLLPQMIIKQPGVADRITTDVGAAGGWNLLTDTFVPQAIPPYVVVELVSRNTAAALAYKTFFDDLDVS